jgi:putative transcriptional regulator
LGVRLNVPTRQLVAHVASDWDHLAVDPAVVYDGGPVRHDGFIAITKLYSAVPPPLRSSMITGRLAAVALSVPVPLVNQAVERLRIFTGYLGWAAGELEADLAEEVLVVAEESAESATFDPRPTTLWHRLQAAERTG